MAKTLNKSKRTVPNPLGGRLPKYCECGGLMDYAFDFGQVWSVCKSCTPVTVVTFNRRGVPICIEANHR